MRCQKSAKRTKPKLWEKVKKQVTAGKKGGPPGKWSARKAQLAVALYKKQGGTYQGSKNLCNSLTKWSREQWDYITPGKKSGRYLPRVVREHLTPAEKKLENRLKGRQFGKNVKYSASVLNKVRKYQRSNLK